MQILELNLISTFVLRPSEIRLPDNVLAWVGGHMAGLGEEAGEGKANIMMGGMVRRTESAANLFRIAGMGQYTENFEEGQSWDFVYELLQG